MQGSDTEKKCGTFESHTRRAETTGYARSSPSDLRVACGGMINDETCDAKDDSTQRGIRNRRRVHRLEFPQVAEKLVDQS